MKLPIQKCPNTEREDCPVCGKWHGWIDLKDPGRSPTPEEWAKVTKSMQQEHNAKRQAQFDAIQVSKGSAS